MIGLRAARAFFTASSKRCSQRMGGRRAEQGEGEDEGCRHRAAFTSASKRGWKSARPVPEGLRVPLHPDHEAPARHLHPLDDPVLAAAGGQHEAVAQPADRLVVEAVHRHLVAAEDRPQPASRAARPPRGSTPSAPCRDRGRPPPPTETGCPGPAFPRWQRLTAGGRGRWRGWGSPGQRLAGQRELEGVAAGMDAGHRGWRLLAVVRGVHVGAAGEHAARPRGRGSSAASSGRPGARTRGSPPAFSMART